MLLAEMARGTVKVLYIIEPIPQNQDSVRTPELRRASLSNVAPKAVCTAPDDQKGQHP